MAKAKKEKMSLEEMLELALVKEEDRPYEVPGNWVWTRFLNVCSFENGYAFKSDDYKENGIPLVRISNIVDNEVDISNCVYIQDREIPEKFIIKRGDLLIAMSGATTGKNGVYSLYIPAYLNQRVGNIKLKSEKLITQKFRDFYVMDKNQEILNKAYGGAQPNISGALIGELLFPLPPISEQQRIVNVIESLFEKLDTARELAQNALDSFGNRKAVMLHKAFTGKLTTKWRETNMFNVEHTAISILEEIREYKTKKLKRSKKLDPIDKSEILFNLPESWIWCNIDDIQEVSGGIQKTPKRKPDKNPIPYLAVANVKRGYLELAEVKEFEVSSEEVEKYMLKYDDILIIEGNGSASEIGRCAIWKDEITPCVHQNHIIKARNYLNLILPEYILYYLNSSIGMELMKSKAKTTAGLYNLSTGKIKEIVVPIPCLEEQKEIVRILDNLLDNEQRAKELCDVIEKIDLMKKAILARAFRGELGTNDPEEESAVELLKEVLLSK